MIVSVPLSTAVGAYVRLSTQPLPFATRAQVKLVGALQPAGSDPLSEIPKPVIARPSLELNVMLMVWFAPTATDTAATEAVATTESSLPDVPLSPPTPTGPVAVPVPVPLPVPPPLPVTLVEPYSDPVPLLPHGELISQPESSKSERAPRRSGRWLGVISLPNLSSAMVEGLSRYAEARRAGVNRVTQSARRQRHL